MTKAGVRSNVRKKLTAGVPAALSTEAKSARRIQIVKNSMPRSSEATLDEREPSPKLTRMAYDKLLRAIVQGRLDLGEPLSENEIARALNLSKAPIRESLGELRLRGLVEVIPRSGSYVFSPTAQQVAELCDYRALLETNALRISMKREPKALVTALRRIVANMKEAHRDEDQIATNELDKEFHMAIIRRSENRYLTESYEHIGLTVEALRYRVMSTSLYRSKVQEEHARLTDLLAKNQIARASRILESHIQRVKRIQGRAEWGSGRLKRKDYHFRDYATILL